MGIKVENLKAEVAMYKTLVRNLRRENKEMWALLVKVNGQTMRYIAENEDAL